MKTHFNSSKTSRYLDFLKRVTQLLKKSFASSVAVLFPVKNVKQIVLNSSCENCVIGGGSDLQWY